MTHSILIVGDGSAIKESVEAYLKRLQYDVKRALNTKEALAILDAFDADLVLADVILQGMDGLELIQKIKGSSRADVMIMTGYSAGYSYGKAVQAGASDFIFKPFHLAELALRIKRVLREAEVKKAHKDRLNELEKLSITDALTGLYNSRHFFSQIKTEIKRYNRYARALSLLILDIDFFKDYNDTFGHLEGDKVLNKTGKTINSCLRSMDTAFRYGGEEFAILLPETKLKEACVAGARIKDNIRSQVFEPEPGEKQLITVSIGVTELLKGEDFRSFIRRADKALYKSKETGRNKLTCFESDAEIH